MLEMGCFDGHMTEMLAKNYDSVTVVEASDDLIAKAKKRVPSATFIHSMFEDWTPEKKFDLIYIVHTLEHLDDPSGVLARAREWLAPGGFLFAVVPNAHAPSRQLAVEMGMITHDAAVTEPERVHGHRITYSLDTLQRDVRKSGLKIVRRGGVFFKTMANFQFDLLMKQDFWEQAFGERYLQSCFQLGEKYPDLCASIYNICQK